MKEPPARLEVTHVKVHVTEHRSRRHSAPLFAAAGTNEPVHVERIHRRDELPVPVLPRFARSVSVDLDSEPVGVGQVHSFAVQVIGHPRVASGFENVLEKAAQRGTVRKEQHEVIQSESPPARHGMCAGALVQFHERARRATENCCRPGCPSSRLVDRPPHVSQRGWRDSPAPHARQGNERQHVGDRKKKLVGRLPAHRLEEELHGICSPE